MLYLAEPAIVKQDTVMRNAVSVEERLSLTLQYLVTGRSFECLKFSANVAPSINNETMMETCDTIISA